MEIKKIEHKRVTVLEINGRIDSSTAGEFEGAVMRLIDSGNRNIVLDMSGVEFLSSAGLRTMVNARKALQLGGAIKLAEPSQRVQDTLEIAGLNVLFDAFADRESAVGSF